jgi:hypothetical protein
MQRALAFVGTLVLSSCASLGPGAANVEGCYSATPALTYSSSGVPERGDTSFAILRLGRGGHASRPLVPPGPMPTGTWRMADDTLHVVVGDGHTGWALTLTFADGEWIGDARYISDGFLVGGTPYRHAIALRPRACVGAG